MNRFSLRSTIALLCAVAVAGAFVAASVMSWLGMRTALRDQIDRYLRDRGSSRIVFTAPSGNRKPLSNRAALCGPSAAAVTSELLLRVEYVWSDGSSCSPGSAKWAIKPTALDRAVARGQSRQTLRDAKTVSGEPVRALTVPFESGVAMVVSRSLSETDAALNSLAVQLVLMSLGGILIAAAAGVLVSRIALRPLAHLAGAAEHVAATDDLDITIGDFTPRRTDEIARVTRAFDAMTSRLSLSRRRQRQLVADAGHELRTPLTSMRTNLEWLMRADDHGRPLSSEARRQVETAVLGQLDELTTLIGEISIVAGDGAPRVLETLDLDRVILHAVQRAQRRAPTRRFEVSLEPWIVRGDPVELERAVLNVMDNALKFSSGPLEIRLRQGRFSVADDGPGLPPSERREAFERFWRAPTARELPGSGLGLAIVADCVARLGGTTFFEGSLAGGALVGFELSSALTESSSSL